MIKFERTKLEFDIYGTKYTLTKPLKRQMDAYSSAFLKAEEEKNIKEQNAILENLLKEVGLPKEVADEMESHHLNALIAEVLSSPKK